MELNLKKNNINGNKYMPASKYNYEYFTIETLASGQFSIGITKSSPVFYSKNNGEWTQISTGANYYTTLSVQPGDKIRLKCEIENGESFPVCMGETSIPFNVYGNILSVVYGDYFADETDITNVYNYLGDYSPFEQMFIETSVRDASNLILPCVYLVPGMYRNMFAHSTITAAPYINSAYLNKECYLGMFLDCPYLSGHIEIPEPFGLSSININPDAYMNEYAASLRAYFKMFYIESDSVIDNALNNEDTALAECAQQQLELKILAGLYTEGEIYINNLLYGIVLDAAKDNGWYALEEFIFNKYKITIVLPWTGSIDNKQELKQYLEENPEGFASELEYFVKEENIYNKSTVGTTTKYEYTSKYKLSPDKFRSILKLYNEDNLFASFVGNGVINSGTAPVYKSYITLKEPLDYFSDIPLTFKVIDTCEFLWTYGNWAGDFACAHDIEYSINNGPWQQIKRGVIANAGDTIAWRSSVNRLDPDYEYGFKNQGEDKQSYALTLQTFSVVNKRYNTETNDWVTTNSGRFDAYGNIMSLVSNEFENISSLDYSKMFCEMFKHTCIQNAKNLVLPAITLSANCYNGMFSFSDIVVPPAVLPCKNYLAKCAYKQMFYNCTKLIKAPIIMAASFLSNENITRRDNDKYYDLTLSFGTDIDKPNLTDSSGHSVSADYGGGYELFFEMFYGCSALLTGPDIKICYLNLNGGGSRWFRGMFYGCDNLKTFKIFTHNSEAGYYTDASNSFSSMFNSYPKNTLEIYSYLRYGFDSKWNNLNDFNIDNILDLSSDSVKFINIHYLNTKDSNNSFDENPVIPDEDTSDYFYIDILSPTNGNTIATLKYEIKNSNYSWLNFFYDMEREGIILPRIGGTVDDYDSFTMTKCYSRTYTFSGLLSDGTYNFIAIPGLYGYGKSNPGKYDTSRSNTGFIKTYKGSQYYHLANLKEPIHANWTYIISPGIPDTAYVELVTQPKSTNVGKPDNVIY